ncbi:MAG: hypothetical protein NBV66_03695 [Burkholderiaceae bacterium]|nr:hypothetical protein [Burkholderiaceae bacterium]
MKKSVTLVIAAAALAVSVLVPAHAGPNQYRHGNQYGYKHHHGYKSNNFNAWNAAALGVGVGVVIAAGSQYNRYVAPPPVYPQVVNVYPPAVPPYGQFYSLPVPCRTAQIPVYDQYGRLVQYQQTCVN